MRETANGLKMSRSGLNMSGSGLGGVGVSSV